MAPALLMGAPGFAQCIDGLPCVEENPDTQNDSKSESEACDGDFMNQIYARAFLESEREIAVAGQAIRKPDSVLEFTCFDAMAKEGLETYNPFFSADTGTPNAVSALNGFNAVIKNPVANYISTSFSHEYFVAGSGQDYSAETSPCKAIQVVQKISRCTDFGDEDADRLIQPFYSFDDLISDDPRILPSGSACTGTKITDGEFEDWIDVADNTDYKFVPFDVFDLYTEQLEGSCTSLAPVGTGVSYEEARPELSWSALGEFIFGTDETVEHKVCVNPVCYYDLYDDKCKAK